MEIKWNIHDISIGIYAREQEQILKMFLVCQKENKKRVLVIFYQTNGYMHTLTNNINMKEKRKRESF